MVNKGESSPYTEAQVAALRALHLTPSLYFSSPTATHFKDRDEAVRTGAIDSFTRYHINIATPQILSGDEFRSGNAFLDRRYVVKVSGKVVEKPKLDTYLQGAIFETKPSNPKAKDTAADLLMAAVADALLLTANRMTNDEIAKALSDAKAEVEACYKVFQGLVMEIGCTGLLPVELENWATRMEPEQFGAKYSIKLGKDEKEGIYYVFPGDLVIAVTPEVSWYTVKPDPVSSEYEATV
jgi:hypothetical protein